jgi:predicted DNA-binding WGR domain protein
MLHLTRNDPSLNMARFYAIDVMPTLFGDWTLVAEWGRIGQSGTIKAEVFSDREAAEQALQKRERSKRRKGYS